MTYPAYKESAIISELSSRFKLGKNFLSIVSIDVGLPRREAIFDAKNRPWFFPIWCRMLFVHVIHVQSTVCSSLIYGVGFVCVVYTYKCKFLLCILECVIIYCCYNNIMY